MGKRTTGKRKEQRYQLIGCATRGGEASRATEDLAIKTAREHQAGLIFLYVVDVRFAHGRSGKFPIDKVAEEVHDIGELILEQAKGRAKEQDVAARGEIREGRTADEIQRFVERHRSMDLLIVGHMSEDLREHLEPVLQALKKRRLDVTVARPT